MSTAVPVSILRKKINGVKTRNDSGANHSAIRVAAARKIVGNQVVRKS